MDGIGPPAAPVEAPAPVPQPAAAPARPYVSPTLPNPRELGALALFVLLLLLALALPWVLIRLTTTNGLDFDTWKLAQAGGGQEMLLPRGEAEFTPTEDGLLADYGGGMLAIAREYPDQRAAVDAWKQRWAQGSWLPEVQGAATTVGSGQWLAFATVRSGRLLEWVSGRNLLQLYAPDDRKLSMMIVASPMIDARGEPDYGRKTAAPLGIRLLRFNGTWTALGLNVLVLLGLGAAWLLGVRRLHLKPPATGRRLGREALRTRLMALNDANTPVRIEEQEPYHLICHWKSDDAEMAQWLSRRNLRDAWQLDLYLGEQASAGLLETAGRLSWNGQRTPPEARYAWSYLREVGRGEAKLPAPADPEKIILPTQSISPADYRETLVQLLHNSGWTVRPLLFRPLVWEYR